MSKKDDFIEILSGMTRMQLVHPEDKSLVEKAITGLWLNYLQNEDKRIVDLNEEDLCNKSS